MSRKNIEYLANEIANSSSDEATSLLLEKARDLYEKVTLLHYTNTIKESVSDQIEEQVITPIKANEPENTVTQAFKSPNTSEENLSVQERIKQIMDTAPSIDEKPKDIPIEIKSEEKSLPVFEKKAETPKDAHIVDEFKDAISADYAADLFEKAEKIEITKKSLNDKLSQKQIQIGLNDRIAFVKHLFDGNQSDFNRVLSQLNTFSEESQAKQFINTVIKPDYNWENKEEYEERLISLIERKFL